MVHRNLPTIPARFGVSRAFVENFSRHFGVSRVFVENFSGRLPCDFTGKSAGKTFDENAANPKMAETFFDKNAANPKTGGDGTTSLRFHQGPHHVGASLVAPAYGHTHTHFFLPHTTHKRSTSAGV